MATLHSSTLPRNFSTSQWSLFPGGNGAPSGWSEGAQDSSTMSHHSDDNMLIASSDSFWEPGNYKRTTKRIEDGYKLCNELITLVQERSDIEKTYAKSLKSWSKKWNDLIEKGPEYGTTEAAWKGVLVEADRLCDLHIKVKDNLCNDVITQVKTWQKDSYHKSMIQIKERKEMEDHFKKAQKPWAKLLQKVNKAKADYHTACKTEKSAANQERNATGDSSLSPDQRAALVKKMQDRVQKVKEDVLKGKEKYDLALQEINAHNPKYVEEMTEVFNKCQEMEAERLRFFKEVLFSMQKCLNISNDPVLPQIYDEFYHTVNNADYEKDLKWWSNNHGVNMAMNWPQFEDYTEELREIAKAKLKDTLPASSITLINQRPVSEDLHRWLGRKPKDNIILINQRPISEDELLHEFPPVNQRLPAKKPVSRVITTDVTSDDRKTSPSAGNNSNAKTNSSPTSAPNNDKTDSSNKTPTITNGTPRAEANPFEEEEWDEEGNEALVDNGEPGVPVKALYDYEGAESDELSFKQGDLFEKLEDEDEQGWCKGRKDGRVGLYPANYVEVVAQ